MDVFKLKKQKISWGKLPKICIIVNLEGGGKLNKLQLLTGFAEETSAAEVED